MKTERFELKLSKADKASLKKAAKRVGKSIASFVLDAAIAATKATTP